MADDLVRHIDQTYRTLAEPARRVIGGLSMGAHGALQLSLTHPGRFGAVGVHSPSLRTAGDTFAFFGRGEAFAQRDPLSLVQQGVAPASRLWIDAGDQDPWSRQVERLSGALDQQRAPHVLRIFPGIHDGSYWSQHIADYLRFYSAALGATAA